VLLVAGFAERGLKDLANLFHVMRRENVPDRGRVFEVADLKKTTEWFFLKRELFLDGHLLGLRRGRATKARGCTLGDNGSRQGSHGIRNLLPDLVDGLLT
jgi:hypothetical protein